MNSIVSFVVRKLGDLIEKEAKLLGRVGKEVKRMERELQRIQQYLDDAQAKRRNGDALVEGWLCSLRDVAYRIEDAIDTFYVELKGNYHENEIEDDGNSLQKSCCSFVGIISNVAHKAMNVPSVHKLGTELSDIQNDLDEIFKSKDTYGITVTLPQERGDCRGSKSAVVLPLRRDAYQDVDGTEVVGLDADMRSILQLLCGPKKPPRRAVITIVGPGGIGKTTLARKVYNRHVHILGYIYF